MYPNIYNINKCKENTLRFIQSKMEIIYLETVERVIATRKGKNAETYVEMEKNNKYLILLSSLSLLYYVLTKFHNVPLMTMFFSFLNTSQHLTDLFILSSNINWYLKAFESSITFEQKSEPNRKERMLINGSVLWNSLPHFIRHSTTVQSFIISQYHKYHVFGARGTLTHNHIQSNLL